MIRINLAKGMAVAGGAGAAASAAEVAEKSVRRTALRNVVLLIIGPLFLMVLEQQMMTEKRGALKSVRLKLTDAQEKNAAAKGAMDEIRKIKAEQEKVQTQIRSLEGVRKPKGQDVKLLEYIRQSIPEHVWLDRLETGDNHVQIKGFAVTDSDLTIFMDALSRSNFLKEVNLLRSQDQNMPEFGSVKRFELACLLEGLGE